MDIDLKNINMSDIKAQITKLADKKTLIKIGIIFGAIIFFLIIYYAILNPMVDSRKAKLNDMNLTPTEFVVEMLKVRLGIGGPERTDHRASASLWSGPPCSSNCAAPPQCLPAAAPALPPWVPCPPCICVLARQRAPRVLPGSHARSPRRV